MRAIREVLILLAACSWLACGQESPGTEALEKRVREQGHEALTDQEWATFAAANPQQAGETLLDEGSNQARQRAQVLIDPWILADAEAAVRWMLDEDCPLLDAERRRVANDLVERDVMEARRLAALFLRDEEGFEILSVPILNHLRETDPKEYHRFVMGTWRVADDNDDHFEVFARAAVLLAETDPEASLVDIDRRIRNGGRDDETAAASVVIATVTFLLGKDPDRMVSWFEEDLQRIRAFDFYEGRLAGAVARNWPGAYVDLVWAARDDEKLNSGWFIQYYQLALGNLSKEDPRAALEFLVKWLDHWSLQEPPDGGLARALSQGGWDRTVKTIVEWNAREARKLLEVVNDSHAVWIEAMILLHEAPFVAAGFLETAAPTQNVRILESVAEAYVAQDLPGAIEWIKRLKVPHGGLAPAQAIVMNAWASQSPRDAAQWAAKANIATNVVARVWAETALADAAQWVTTLHRDAYAVVPIVEALAKEDPDKALAWLSERPNGEGRLYACQALIRDWLESDRPRALAAAELLPEDSRRDGIGKVLNEWLFDDPDTVLKLLPDTSLSDRAKKHFGDMARRRKRVRVE